MKKLTLEHIRNYKNLETVCGHYVVGTYTGKGKRTRPLFLSDSPDGEITWEVNLDMVQFILRPLFDLNKKEWYFKFGINLFDEDMQRYIMSGKINGIPFWFMQEMFKHHFDVFGLIEKKLAIDINTLT